MNRQTIHPDDEAHWLSLRTVDLTSTDIAALFGLSPYKTHYELWHEKKSGERAPFNENDRVKWGKRLESTVAQGIAEDQSWLVRPMKEYVRLPDLRLGSSFDFRIMSVDGVPMLMPNQSLADFDSPNDAHLEIKCVDFLAYRDGWTVEEGFIEAPPHIEIQVQHQMLVSGLERAYIGVMVGGNRIEVIERQADPDVQAGILARAAEFWTSIDDNAPPEPVMPDDATAIIRMNQFAEPGKFRDMRGDANLATLLREYQQFGAVKADAEECQEVRKAAILQLIGDAEKVISDVGKVSAGIVGPAEIAYTRKPYRSFRFTPAKVAQEAQPQ